MKKYIFFLVFIAVAFVSCESTIPLGNFDRETFTSERRLWLEQDIQNYSFTQESYSFRNGMGNPGPSNGTIYVKNGIPVFVWPGGWSEGYYLTEEEYSHFIRQLFARTISEIYTWIEMILDDSSGPRDTIEIKYNSEWHYPEYFHRRRANSSYFKNDGSSLCVQIFEFFVDPEIHGE